MTLSRRASVDQFAGAFGPNASPPRRDDAGEPGDPGPDIAAEAPDAPPLASSPPRPVPAAARTPARRATPSRSRPAGLPDDHSTWVGVRTEGLRYGAQLRRFHERGQALAKSIDEAMGLGATRAEVIRNLTARNARTDLTVDELAMMPEVAERLGLDQRP